MKEPSSLALRYRDRLADVMAETLLLILVTDHGHGAVLTQSTSLLEEITIRIFVRIAHLRTQHTFIRSKVLCCDKII